MVTQAEVLKFLSMSIFQKAKLKEDNPARYEELLKEAKRSFDPSTDQQAAAELVKK